MLNSPMPIGVFAKLLGVTVATVRRWEKSGRIPKARRTPGGHRRFTPHQTTQTSAGRTVCYARVSCSDQRDDLDRQAERLQDHAQSQGWDDVEVIADLGSGLNFAKKDLRRLLAMLLHGELRRLVIENKDRLLRFGSELVFQLCKALNVEVVVLAEPVARSADQDLARDVLDILTVYSARLYGARSAQRRKKSSLGTLIA